MLGGIRLLGLFNWRYQIRYRSICMRNNLDFIKSVDYCLDQRDPSHSGTAARYLMSQGKVQVPIFICFHGSTSLTRHNTRFVSIPLHHSHSFTADQQSLAEPDTSSRSTSRLPRVPQLLSLSIGSVISYATGVASSRDSYSERGTPVRDCLEAP